MEWHFFDEGISNYLNGTKKECDYIGAVRSGELCFDLVVRDDNELCVDLYVGGIDSGYGYTDDGYPYDFQGSIGYTWDYNMLEEMDINAFKRFVEDKLTTLIKNSNPVSFNNTEYTLLDKANCALHIW